MSQFNYLDYKNKIPLDKCLIEIPKINPLSINYEKFWIHTMKRKQIEGHWVEHNKEYKWIPGTIFHYCNLGRIERKSKSAGSKGKVIGTPDLRDLEWIKGYIHAVARGFSGFENDTKYSCHRILIHPDRDELINYLPTKIRESLYTVDRDLKEYREPVEYLYTYFKENLGKPLYYNTAKNVLEIGARNYGKSVFSANICIHNFLTDGATDFEEWYENYKKSKDDPNKIIFTTQTLLGAIDAKYVNNLTHHIKVGLENLPGSYQLGDKLYPPPLSKTYMGSWMVGKNITARYQSKVGGKWEWRGTGSSFAMRSFNDNPYAANGLRYGLGLIDEVGFHYNLLDTLGQLHECTTVDGEKYGTLWMCVCEGTKVFRSDGSIVNIEDLKKEDGIIGWDDETKSESPTTIEKMYSPTLKDCYRITTHKGKVLECSYDHPILWTKNGFGSRPRSKENKCNRKFIRKKIWKNASDIKIGDQILSADKIEVFGTHEMKDPRFIGMLIGDGAYGFNKTPVFSNCDDELNNYIYENYNCVLEKEYITKDGRNYKETRIREICPMLRDIGIYGQTKANKRLPDIIFKSTKENVCDLLAGLYDTDGHLSISHNKPVIGLTSSSKEMLIQVNLLLQKLGIHANLIEQLPRISENRKDKNKYYKLNIHDKRSIFRFRDNINLLINYKKEKLNQICDIISNKKERQSDNLEGLRIEKVINVEYIGKKKVFNLTASGHNTYLANGIVTHNTGTGGDMASGATEQAMKVFYDGEAFDCLTFDDIFENKGQIGLFIPAWMTLSEFRDELGNINKELAMKKLLKEREVAANAKTKDALYSLLQMKPLVPSEAFLVLEGNIFPIGELKEHLSYLETNDKAGDLGNNGWMYRDDAGKPYFKVDLSLKPATYPTKESQDPKSAVVIWEEPVSNPPYGAYIIGVDPYDQDKAENSVSYGSCFVYKRFITADQTYHIPVAEYTGRPDFADDFYEQCRRLAEYYNAKILFENQNTGIKKYFEIKRCTYLLHTQPNIIKAISPSSNVNRGYGIHMTKPIKEEIEIMIRDWLKTEIEPGIMQLTKICSIPLLKELIAYDGERNTDRVIAFGLTVLQDAEMHLIRVSEKKEIKRDDFFKKQLFI